MWQLLKIKHLIDNTFQVTCENETHIYYVGSYEDCRRFKCSE